MTANTASKAKRGRPPVGPLITLRMPTALAARLTRHARATGTTRSELIRRYARDGLEAEEATP